MRLLVCGGRDWDDFEVLNEELTWIAENARIDVIIHGGARGADTLAGAWATLSRVPVEVYRAKWDKHGPAAGPIRNREMLAKGRPDMVLAFPGGKGTRDMVERAREAGLIVREVKADISCDTAAGRK